MAETKNSTIQRAKTAARSNVERAGTRVKEAGAKAGEKIADARGKADDLAATTNRIVTEHPMAAIAAAAAFGAFAAYMMPRSAKAVKAAAPALGGLAANARKEVQGIAKAGLEQASNILSSTAQQVESTLKTEGMKKIASETVAKLASKVRRAKDATETDSPEE